MEIYLEVGCASMRVIVLWFMASQRLLINLKRKRCHIVIEAYCYHCMDMDKTIMHVLKDCQFAK